MAISYVDANKRNVKTKVTEGYVELLCSLKVSESVPHPFSSSFSLINITIIYMADSFFTSNEGYSVPQTHMQAKDTRNAHLLMLLCATAAPPTQLLSRECPGPSNSERESEQKRKILAREGERGMGKEKEMGGRGSHGALISDESNSVNCC